MALGHSIPWAGHYSARQTHQRISLSARWPGMAGDIAIFVRSCGPCQRAKARALPPSSLHFSSGTYPTEIVQVDLLGPLAPEDDLKHITVIIDTFSKFAMLIPVTDTRAETVGRAFLEYVRCFGCPTRIVSDGGPSFDANLFRDLCAWLQSTHSITCPFHPQGHGQVERLNCEINKMLRTLLLTDRAQKWTNLLTPISLAYNSHINRATGYSPFFLMFGIPPRTPLQAELDVSLAPSASTPSQFVRERSALFTRVWKATREAEWKAYLATRTRFLERRHQTFKVGDYVLMLRPRPNKLAAAWQGPCAIVAPDDTSPNAWLVENLATLVRTRT